MSVDPGRENEAQADVGKSWRQYPKHLTVWPSARVVVMFASLLASVTEFGSMSVNATSTPGFKGMPNILSTNSMETFRCKTMDSVIRSKPSLRNERYAININSHCMRFSGSRIQSCRAMRLVCDDNIKRQQPWQSLHHPPRVLGNAQDTCAPRSQHRPVTVFLKHPLQFLTSNSSSTMSVVCVCVSDCTATTPKLESSSAPCCESSCPAFAAMKRFPPRRGLSDRSAFGSVKRDRGRARFLAEPGVPLEALDAHAPCSASSRAAKASMASEPSRELKMPSRA